MAFHLWTLGLLVVVVIAYVLISRLGARKDKEKIVRKDFKGDFGELMYYGGKFVVYFFIVLGHLFRFVKDGLVRFWGWYMKDKRKPKVTVVPKNHLWCPRCKAYFHRSHSCFRGVN